MKILAGRQQWQVDLVFSSSLFGGGAQLKVNRSLVAVAAGIQAHTPRSGQINLVRKLCLQFASCIFSSCVIFSCSYTCMPPYMEVSQRICWFLCWSLRFSLLYWIFEVGLRLSLSSVQILK